MLSVVGCFASCGLAVWAGIWFMCLLAEHVARTRYRNAARLHETAQALESPSSAAQETKEKINNDDVPGVSIIRPLHNVDPHLHLNLESSFRQQYPKFEIILSVADANDPAIPVVRAVQHKFPHVDSTLIIGDEDVGVNPKINNLIRPYKAAKYDILYVCDSNTKASSPLTLANAVPLFSRQRPDGRSVGLVHHVPVGISANTFSSRVEQVFLATGHAKAYLSMNKLQMGSLVLGKSCLYRKSDLERTAFAMAAKAEDAKACAMQAFGCYLSEDNMIGIAIWDLGLRHEMNGEVIANTLAGMTWSAYCWRRIRWIRARKYMLLPQTCLEPFTECFVNGLVGALGFRYFTSFSATTFFALHVLAWYLIDRSIYNSLYAALPKYETANEAVKFSSLAWLAREISALPIFLYAMCSNNISWRSGVVYRVGTDNIVRRAKA